MYCDDLDESYAGSSEYAFEKKLCIETQCAKSDRKTTDGYSNPCGRACRMMDDRHILCVRRDIEKYCSDPNGLDKVKCDRYCAKASNAHALCKNNQYFKSFVEEEDCNKYCNRTSNNFSEERCNDKCGGMFDRYNAKSSQDPKKVEKNGDNSEEPELAKKENEIKNNVEAMNDSIVELSSQSDAVLNQNANQSKFKKIKAFMMGSDKQNREQLEAQIMANNEKTKELRELLGQTETDDNKALIKEKIRTLEQNKLSLGSALSENLNSFSIFGWFKDFGNRINNKLSI